MLSGYPGTKDLVTPHPYSGETGPPEVRSMDRATPHLETDIRHFRTQMGGEQALQIHFATCRWSVWWSVPLLSKPDPAIPRLGI